MRSWNISLCCSLTDLRCQKIWPLRLSVFVVCKCTETCGFCLSQGFQFFIKQIFILSVWISLRRNRLSETWGANSPHSRKTLSKAPCDITDSLLQCGVQLKTKILSVIQVLGVLRYIPGFWFKSNWVVNFFFHLFFVLKIINNKKSWYV